VIVKRIGAALRARDWTAVGIEFAIVVLGIFVALQAEDWNQGRRDLRLEEVYISRLIDETKANIEILSEHEQIFADKVQFILDLPDLPLEQEFHRDPRVFMHQLDFSTYMATPDLRSETYQELESSGRLSLLRNTQLRSAIASNLNDYRSLRPVLAQPIGTYRQMLFETLPGRSFYDFWTSSEALDSAVIIASVEAFRSDPRFEAAANAEISYGADALAWMRKYKSRTEEILVLLQTEE